MKVETKNTITTKFELTGEEITILNKANNLLTEIYEHLFNVAGFALCDLEQMAEEDTLLPNELKDIAIFLALNGKTLTFEE